MRSMPTDAILVPTRCSVRSLARPPGWIQPKRSDRPCSRRASAVPTVVRSLSIVASTSDRTAVAAVRVALPCPTVQICRVVGRRPKRPSDDRPIALETEGKVIWPRRSARPEWPAPADRTGRTTRKRWRGRIAK